VTQFGSEYLTSGTFWFTLSLLNAGLAQSKQRSGFNWWLISLIAGPIATLLLVTWSPGDSAREPVRWEITWTQLGLIVLALILFGLGTFALVQVTN
jgi:hypothetical protein